MIRVAVIDDHPVASAGVVAALAEAGDIEIVGRAAALDEIKALVETTSPDILLCDVQLGTVVNAAPIVTHLVTATGWIVPAFSAFSDRKDDFVHGIAVPAGYVIDTLAYGVTYIVVAVGAATAIFGRREFK